MRKVGLAAAAALLATPLLAGSASAATCPVVVGNPQSTYTNSFSCTLDGGALTFSNFFITSTPNVTLTGMDVFNPYPGTADFGLGLIYGATFSAANTLADVTFNFTVAGNGVSITDIAALLSASQTGTGTVSLT